MRCIVATANPDKAAEIVAIMSSAINLELIERPNDIPDVEETGETLVENALLKAQAIYETTGELTIADDTGLFVDALGGAPGVRSARFAGEHARYEDNVAKLLNELHDADDRSARFETVAVAILSGGEQLIATGTVEGVITREPEGSNGFGYDPVFIPLEANGKTFAQLSSAEKAAMSHRGRAFQALATQVQQALA